MIMTYIYKYQYGFKMHNLPNEKDYFFFQNNFSSVLNFDDDKKQTNANSTHFWVNTFFVKHFFWFWIFARPIIEKKNYNHEPNSMWLKNEMLTAIFFSFAQWKCPRFDLIEMNVVLTHDATSFWQWACENRKTILFCSQIVFLMVRPTNIFEYTLWINLQDDKIFFQQLRRPFDFCEPKVKDISHTYLQYFCHIFDIFLNVE